MDASTRLDALAEREALAAFLRCCGSRRWAEAMTAGRPYRDERALVAAAERAFAPLAREDWLEAFSRHPRIGDRKALAARFGPAASEEASIETRARDWPAAEQSAVAGAGEGVKGALLSA